MLLMALLGWYAALCAPPTLAGGTHNLAVGATVLSNSNCKFRNGSDDQLAFGAIDPSSTANRTASANLVIRCAGSAPTATYLLASDGGLYATGSNAPRMRHATDTSRFLPYSVNLPQSGTIPKNTEHTVTINGTVIVSDFANAAAGAYADTVVVTLTP